MNRREPLALQKSPRDRFAFPDERLTDGQREQERRQRERGSSIKDRRQESKERERERKVRRERVSEGRRTGGQIRRQESLVFSRHTHTDMEERHTHRLLPLPSLVVECETQV